jgi:hypothetical protein
VLAALLLAAGTGPSVADAERAFAALAQSDGQWPAFRATAAPDAILYAPDKVNAQALLARAPTPATTLNWRPARTLTSCDGTMAYSTGPWTRSDGKTGSFGTVWRADAGGWRWIYDGGHDGGAMADTPAPVIESHAACPGPIGSVGKIPDDSQPDATAIRLGGEFGGVGRNAPVPVTTLKKQALADLIEASDGPMPLAIKLGVIVFTSASTDRTLVSRINVIANDKPGAHLLRLWSWDGRRYRLAVLDVSTQ